MVASARDVLATNQGKPSGPRITFSADVLNMPDVLSKLVLSNKANWNLGGYKLTGKSLGNGGCGAVLEGADPNSGTKFAIKFVAPNQAIRFKKEEYQLKLIHYNIVRSYHSGKISFPGDDGTSINVPYLVMALADDMPTSLFDLMPKNGKPLKGENLKRALSAVRDAALGLDYLHKRGIYHRDMKPENILFVNGVAQVSDLGLIKNLTDVDRTITLDGTIQGTPGYMSPEQANYGRRVTDASDLWALGVILYEITTGISPYKVLNDRSKVDLMATLQKTTSGQPPLEPKTINPEISDTLNFLTMKLLSPSPQNRRFTYGTSGVVHTLDSIVSPSDNYQPWNLIPEPQARDFLRSRGWDIPEPSYGYISGFFRYAGNAAVSLASNAISIFV